MTISHFGTHPQRSMSVARALLVALAVVIVSTTSRAQSFPSGSDDSDSALTVEPNQGVIIFDPRDTARWGKVLDPDGDGVYNFTTITINAGSTLRLQGDKVNRPVYWLASGDVVINGTLDLSGASGGGTSDPNVRRQGAIPGSGGFAGGAGGDGTFSPTPGDGPGGGIGGARCVSSTDPRVCGAPGTFTGNRYLIPLIGGSGGAGGDKWGTFSGGGLSYFNGGAGGGAILIASSTSITLGTSGTITASGGGFFTPVHQRGNLALGGLGSGGAIRLIAPSLAGSGHLNVNGGANGAGAPGVVRLEGFSISTSFVYDGGEAFVTRGSPIDPATLRPAGSIRVTVIDGVLVPVNPSGSFVFRDVPYQQCRARECGDRGDRHPQRHSRYVARLSSNTDRFGDGEFTHRAGDAIRHVAVVNGDSHVYVSVWLLARFRARDVDAVMLNAWTLRRLRGSYCRSCPFLALSAHQRPANASKRRHKAKGRNRPIPRVKGQDPATSSTRKQSAATASFSAC